MNRYRRTILSAGILAVSLFYFLYALFCIESRHVRGVPDSAFIPSIVGGAMVLLSAVMTLDDFKKDHMADGKEEKKAEKKENLNVLGTAVLLLVYICLIEPLGFLIASVLYLFAQFLYLAPADKLKKLRTYVVYGLIALVASGGIYVLFLNVFHLILPAGLLK